MNYWNIIKDLFIMHWCLQKNENWDTLNEGMVLESDADY